MRLTARLCNSSSGRLRGSGPLVDAVDAYLPPSGLFLVPDATWAAALQTGERTVVVGSVTDAPAGRADVVALLADELSAAGEHAEILLAATVAAARPGGLTAVTAPNRVFAEAIGNEPDGRRGYSADELARMLGHRGCSVELLAAPGATARLAGADGVDLTRDRRPGLLDSAPALLAVARTPPDAASRSREFFSSLPRKVLAAAVLCRSDDGRILVVHDAFKQHWTIPGGVVEADEDPRSGAEREAWEESGIRITAGELLGTFAGRHPDRVVFVYGGVPEAGGTPEPAPVHVHEIDAAAWVSLDEALECVAPSVAYQIRHCLGEPYRTWRQ